MLIFLTSDCDIERKKLFLNTIGLDKMSQLLTTEPDIAIHAVRIIHYLCFPIAQEVHYSNMVIFFKWPIQTTPLKTQKHTTTITTITITLSDFYPVV
jgi:hypothetical protein